MGFDVSSDSPELTSSKSNNNTNGSHDHQACDSCGRLLNILVCTAIVICTLGSLILAVFASSGFGQKEFIIWASRYLEICYFCFCFSSAVSLFLTVQVGCVLELTSKKAKVLSMLNAGIWTLFTVMIFLGLLMFYAASIHSEKQNHWDFTTPFLVIAFVFWIICLFINLFLIAEMLFRFKASHSNTNTIEETELSLKSEETSTV